MSETIYVMATEPQAGKSLITFSLMDILQKHYPKVGYFRPITALSADGTDSHIEAVKNLYPACGRLTGMSQDEVTEKIKHQQKSDITQKLYEAYLPFAAEHDMVLCEGMDPTQINSPIGLDLNLDLALAFDSSVVCLINAQNKTLDEIENECAFTLQMLRSRGCQVLALLINRVLHAQRSTLENQLKKLPQMPEIVGLIPEEDTLKKPSMYDVAHCLNAEVLWGENALGRIAKRQVIAAKHPSSFLTSNYSHEDSLVITPGDRQDILLSCLLADRSANYPNIAGIVLSTGHRPDANTSRIIDGLDNIPPILLTMYNTFDVATHLHDIRCQTAFWHPERLAQGIHHFQDSVDTEALLSQLKKPRKHSYITPLMFKHQLQKQAQSDVQHIVLPEGEDIRILQAAASLTQKACVKLTLLGNPETIADIAQNEGLDLGDCQIIDPVTSEHKEAYAKHLFELRKHKKMTINIAKNLIEDANYYATCMVHLGHADGMVSGACHTTGDTVRPALQIIKTRKDQPMVSSVFFMCTDKRIMLYADCALNIDPNASELATIAKQTADTARQMGITPRIAMLSYSSGQSGQGAGVEKVREATKSLQAQCPDINIAGPIQYDAAVDPGVALQKMPQSGWGGDANVLIFPDLDTGNNTYKAVARESNALAIGPVLQGLNAPVNDLSRGCNTQEVVLTVLITALQAQFLKKDRS